MANSQNPTREFKETTQALKDDVVKLGKITKDMAAQTMEGLKENASEYYRQGVEKAQSWEKNLEGSIKKNPLQSVLIAAGVGLVLGILFKKR